MGSQTRNFDPRQILEQYSAPYRPDSAQVAQIARGFSRALVWRVETPAGPCALRAMETASVNRHRLAGLHRLVAHVSSSGMTEVPVPIAGLDGSTFFERRGSVWQLEPWMPGSADYAAHPSDVRLRAALRSLARWHRAAARFVARDAERAWFFSSGSGSSPGLAERAGEIARWNDENCGLVRQRLAASPWKEFAALGREILNHYRRAAPSVAGKLKPGLEARVPLQPCLRDVWRDHVLFTVDKVTGLIDPHAARSDSVATDLARLLGSLVGDDRRAWNIGLEAYQEVRTLSVTELALVELFNQTAVLLAGMTWLDWYCLQGRVFEDREKIIGRLREIIARLSVLASS
ncbi:MAG: phosphotransferase enzyme family protein [Deltaproteobacteria bacterium]